MEKPVTNEQLKVYLDYIDKEMTIMGILSTFCILTMGVVSEKLLFPPRDGPIFEIWKNTAILCETGIAGFLFAGLCFYILRSRLAWFYGELSLNQARENPLEVQKLLNDPAASYNWRWYQIGFGSLSLAFFELGLATTATFIPSIATHQLAFAGGAAVLTGMVSIIIIRA